MGYAIASVTTAASRTGSGRDPGCGSTRVPVKGSMVTDQWDNWLLTVETVDLLLSSRTGTRVLSHPGSRPDAVPGVAVVIYAMLKSWRSDDLVSFDDPAVHVRGGPTIR